MDDDDRSHSAERHRHSLPRRRRHRKPKQQHPQTTVDDFWNVFTAKFPGKVSGILPANIFAKSKAAHEPRGVIHGQSALKSYDETVTECRAAVGKIAKECRRVNMRYRDPHFDLEFDLKRNKNDCLESLVAGNDHPFEPNSVKRVPVSRMSFWSISSVLEADLCIKEIFESPQFTIDDATASDVRQGKDGDCWFLSALCALSNKPGLIDRVCVARDEVVGVYGFVFHRGMQQPITLKMSTNPDRRRMVSHHY